MNQQALTNPITEDDIANYLANSPDFFQRHAELLASVHLASPHNNRAVSLQERQATLLRDKIKVLESRTMDMIRHGNENAMLPGQLEAKARQQSDANGGLLFTAAELAEFNEINRELGRAEWNPETMKKAL